MTMHADITSVLRNDLPPATLSIRRSPFLQGILLSAALLLASFGVIFQALSCCDCALAATWPAHSPRLSTSMGFHDTYSAGDQCYVHSGIDISASAGSQIVAPLAGRVSFAGSIPSGDSLVTGGGEGQTMRAVSIALADGRTVTLMPFAQVNVAVNDKVAEGAVLGTLAAEGDRSIAMTHLHMGLKSDGVYLDPMTLFEPAGKAAEQQAQIGTAAETPAPALSAETAPEAAQSFVTHPDFAAAQEATSLGDIAAQQAQEPAFNTITSGDSEALAASVRENAETAKESPFAPALNWAGDLLKACADQAVELHDGLQSLAAFVGIPFAVVAISAAVLSIAVVAVLALIILRRGLPFAASVLEKRKSALVRRQFG